MPCSQIQGPSRILEQKRHAFPKHTPVHVFHREMLDEAVTAGISFTRLRLTTEDSKRLLAAAGAQIKTERAALTGG
jgi:hypothetical protein